MLELIFNCTLNLTFRHIVDILSINIKNFTTLFFIEVPLVVPNTAGWAAMCVRGI